jgi:hypothetical protein
MTDVPRLAASIESSSASTLLGAVPPRSPRSRRNERSTCSRVSASVTRTGASARSYASAKGAGSPSRSVSAPAETSESPPRGDMPPCDIAESPRVATEDSRRDERTTAEATSEPRDSERL